MSQRRMISLTSLASENDQAQTVPRVVAAGTTVFREYREFASAQRCVFILEITAIAGTSPTLDLTLQAQNPMTGNWFNVLAGNLFPQQTTANTPTPVTMELYYKAYRVQAVVGGTASPTFTMTLCALLNTEEAVV